MTETTEKVSFIFPVHNEARTIENTIHRYHAEYKGKIDFEMILLEDGSSDETRAVVLEVSKAIPLTLYSEPKRKGYLKAVKDGMKYARHDWICLVDGDFQFSPEEFWKLWSKREYHDLILGMKINRKDGPLRLILSRGYNFLMRTLFNFDYRDADTGFRLIRRELSERVSPEVKFLHTFTSEFVIRTHARGAKIIEVPINHLKREYGDSQIFKLHTIPFLVVREFAGLCRLYLELKKKA